MPEKLNTAKSIDPNKTRNDRVNNSNTARNRTRRNFRKLVKKVLNVKKAFKYFGADTEAIIDYINRLPLQVTRNAVTEIENFIIVDENFSNSEHSFEEFKKLKKINSGMSSASASESESNDISRTNSAMSSASASESESESNDISRTNSAMSSQSDYDIGEQGKQFIEDDIGEQGKQFIEEGIDFVHHFIYSEVDPNYHLCGMGNSNFTKNNDDPANYEPQYCNNNNELYDKANGRVPYYPIPPIPPSTEDKPHRCIFGITGHGNAKTPRNTKQFFPIEGGPNAVLYFAAAMGNALLVSTLDDTLIDMQARQFSPQLDNYVSDFVDGCDNLTRERLNPKTITGDNDISINVKRKKTVYSYNNVYLNKIYNMHHDIYDVLPDIPISQDKINIFNNLNNRQKLEIFANTFNFGLILYENSFGIPSGTRINIEGITDNGGNVSFQDILTFIIDKFKLQKWDTVCFYDKTCNPVIRGFKDPREIRLVSRVFDKLIDEINNGMSFLYLFDRFMLSDFRAIVDDIKYPVTTTIQKEGIVKRRLIEYLQYESEEFQNMVLGWLETKEEMEKISKETRTEIEDNKNKSNENSIGSLYLQDLLRATAKHHTRDDELSGDFGGATAKPGGSKTKKQKTKKQKTKKQNIRHR